MSPQNISTRRVAQKLTFSKHPPFTDGATLWGFQHHPTRQWLMGS